MLSSNGFRRRGGISAIKNSKQLQLSQLASAQQIERSFRTNNQVKFNKINESNHAILKNRKKQQEFQRTIQQISHRKCTFYKMGFKSYEKLSNKKIFGEVLGLGSAQMKGTMQIGQLWANHQAGKFLKQNKIYMTKLKLMDNLQNLRKDLDQRGVNKSQSEIQSCRSFGTNHNINSSHLIKSINGAQQILKRKTIHNNFQNLKRQLKTLTKASSQQCLDNDIQYLQRCKEKLQKVQRTYFLKMIQIQ